MKKYKAGIIGCGRVAGLLENDTLRTYPCTHMGGYQDHSRIEVVACCSRTIDGAKKFAEEFNIPKVYTDYAEMLRREKLDIVSIAAYAPTRAEMTCAAARNGVKAIFCEKVMATTLAEADMMITTCEENNVVLCVNHTRRWDHHYIGAKQMIDDGAIGKVQSISGTFSGNLLHTGIHMFDAMIYFAGDVETVSGTLVEHDAETDSASGYTFSEQKCDELDDEVNDKDGYATILFRNGIAGHLLGIGKKYFVFEIDIQGTEGRIRIGNNLFELWQMKESTHYSDFRELMLVTKAVPGKHPPGMVLAIRDIIDAIEQKRRVQCDGVDARRSLECALAVYESHDQGSVPIRLPLTNRTIRVVSR